MSKDRDNKIMGIIVIIVVILIIIQTANNIIQLNKLHNQNLEEKPLIVGTVTQVSDTALSGAAGFSSSASTSYCNNLPPILNYDCNMTNAALNSSLNYNCTFNATDPNGDTIAFSIQWITPPTMFNITPNGTINFNPKRASMGHENWFRIHTTDNSGCANADSYTDFNVTVNGTNRPPYLIKNIPDQQIVKDHDFIFYLSDYFADPDDDPLGYFKITMSGTTAGVTIRGNQVTVKGLDCGNTTVYYVAVDSPFGATAWSNIVNYEITCPLTSSQKAGNNQQEQGKGGGGGGGPQEKCTPNWKCTAWGPCNFGNFTYRRCIDYSGCDIKNYQHYMFENCTYIRNINCAENWDCNNWSICKDNIHTRLCLDMKNCGTNNTKPAESENCSAVPSCFNGIQDQNETGVDCGGPCGPCRNVEKPTKIGALSLVTILIGAFTIGMTGLIVFAFRNRIIAAYKRIFGKKPRLKRKVYINNKQKEKLLLLLNIIQARVDEHKIDPAVDELSQFVKEYFKQLLSLDRLDKQELINQIIKLKDKELETLLVMFYAKILNTVHLRNKGIEIKESEIQALIDEISHEIYLIAEFTDQDAINSIKDRSIESKEVLDRLYNKLSNLYIALKFGEILIAKSMYKEILKDYEKLSIKDRSIPYTDIIRAFHAINYLEKQYKE